jgi:deoxyribonuclease V
MKIPQSLRWDVTPREAMEIQRELAARVREEKLIRPVHFVAGVDVGFEGAQNETARAAVVVLKFPELVPVDYAIARRPVTFPYIPGLLAFRECPVVLDACAQLKTTPDVLIVDGHGRAHPRRLGIASHLGVVLDRAAIGCAKSLLTGHAPMPRDELGAWEPLKDGDEIIGASVRTRAGTQPVYVSVGHQIDLESAIGLVVKCCAGYRLPETTRWAHRVAGGEEIKLPDTGQGETGKQLSFL